MSYTRLCLFFVHVERIFRLFLAKKFTAHFLYNRGVLPKEGLSADTVSMHIVYVLESLKDHGWYIGYTTDLGKRFLAHNQGRNRSTVIRRPWKLIYAEAYLEKMDALGREKFLKSGNGREILKKQMRCYLQESSNYLY